jgi:HEAT repeat protein
VTARKLRSVLMAIVLASPWATPAHSHGGVYRGSGDVVPPPPAQPDPGGSVGSGRSPGGGGGGGGTGPATPQPTPGKGGANGLPAGASGAGLPTPLDEAAVASTWEAWWRMNRDEFLPPRRSRSSLDDDLVALELNAAARDLVLPVLLETLRATKSDEVRAAGLIAVARLGSLSSSRSELRDLIEPRLADPHQEVAETAAVALGLLGDRRSLDVLRETMLGDRARLRERDLELGAIPERTRAFAAYGLGLLGERTSHVERSSIVTTLVQWVDAEAARAAQAELSTACIVALSLVPLPMDTRRAVHGDWPVGLPERVDSLDAQILWLVHRLGDRSLPFQLRAQAPTALARLASATPARHWLRSLAIHECAARLAERAVEPLEVQAGCVLALGLLGDAGAEPESDKARRALSETIARRRDPTLAGLALISLGRASSRPGSGAEPWKALLDARGPRHVLAELVRGERSDDRSCAAIGLALLERGAAERDGPDAASLELLRDELAESRSPEAVSAFALALGLAGDRTAAPALRAELTRNSDPSVKGYLALALGMLRDPSAAEDLEELLRRSRFRPEIVQPVSRALAMLGSPKVEDRLLQLLSEAGSSASKSVLAIGLANVGGTRSMAALIAEVRRETLPEAARAITLAALGRLADLREHPWTFTVSRSANPVGAVTTLISPLAGDGLLDLL